MMKTKLATRLAVAFIWGGTSITMATPATNTIGEVINGTAPDALVWGNGAFLI